MKNISCFILFFFCTSLLGDAEMMHKLHVLQYPGLSNMSPLVTLTLTHTLTGKHSCFLSSSEG